MKIAIPASEQHIDSPVDERFGRCPFFCFYDTLNKQILFTENDLRYGSGGIGPQVSEFLANSNINKVIAMEIGPKTKDVLNKMKIEIQLINNIQSIREIIEKFTI